MFRLAEEGYPFILFFLLPAVASALLGWMWAAGAGLVLTGFMLYFFRDPDRETPADGNAFISPADGKVILITEAEEEEVLKSRALKISIFMSPLNVHVNRSPCDGVVRSVRHYPGRFYSAFRDNASILNEHITMLLECERHGRIVVKQIAGAVARRAVCRVKPGDRLARGQRYGMIKFSSRLDVFLPLDTRVRVKLNDRVFAGETVIGVREPDG